MTPATESTTLLPGNSDGNAARKAFDGKDVEASK
jgi:hypothetical protein